MNLQEQINRIQSMMGVINEDSDRHNNLPPYLYHLTSLEKFNNIKKEGGLNPKHSKL